MGEYVKQTWANGDPTKPVSAARLGHLETQFDRALETVAEQIGDATSDIGAELNSAIAGFGEQSFVAVAQQFAPVPVVTARPCTVTVSTRSSAATVIPSGRAAAAGFLAAYAPNDLSRFSYLGSEPTVNAGATFPDNMAASFDYVDGVVNGLAPFKAKMQHSGRYLELVFKHYANARYWIFVDGVPLNIQPFGATGSGFASILLDFGSTTGTRLVEVRAAGTKFYGANVEAVTGKILATPRVGPRVVLVGDSYLAGANGVSGLSTGGGLLSDLLQVPDMWNLSQGGTGYLNPGATSKARDRIAQVTRLAPQVVIVALGHNDENSTTYPRPALTTEVQTYLAALRAALPTTQIIVTGPLTQGSATAAYVGVQQAIFGGAAASADELVDTITANPFTGTGRLGTPAHDGNSDLYISEDTVHPTQDGHAYLAWWLSLRLRPLLLTARFTDITPPPPNSGSPFTDVFNRADSTTTLGHAWAALSGVWGVSGGKAYVVSGGAFNFAVHDAESPDVVIDVTVAGSSASGAGISVRTSSNTNGVYVAFADGGGVKVYRNVAGSVTQIGSFTVAVVTGDVMRVRAVGDTIEVYRNGTLIISVTESAFNTVTTHGLWALGAASAATKSWASLSIVAVETSATGAVPYTGLLVGNSRQFQKFRLAMGRTRAGIADTKVLSVGDSTTAGIGSSGTQSGTPTSFPYQLASILGGYVPAAKGLGIPPSILSGNPDSRWTAGAGWSVTTLGWGEGADYTAAAGASGTLVYADPGVLADRFDVYFATNSGLGTFTVQATGGSSVDQATAAAGGVGKVTVSAGSAATSNAVTISGPTGGAVHILGIEPWLSTARRVRVGNAGVGSSTTSKWVASATTFGGPGCIRAYQPDLTIISLGINDATTAVAPATYLANIQTLITAAQVSGDVIVIPPFPSAAGALANQLAYEPVYEQALRTLRVPFFDLYARFWKPGAEAIGLPSGMMNDQVHPNAFGYADWASAFAAEMVRI
jgi:lysophospholipase L1-like esterase